MKTMIAGFVLLTALGAYAVAPEPFMEDLAETLDPRQLFHTIPVPEIYPRSLGKMETVADRLVANGREMRIVRFETMDPLDLVLHFYEEQWQSKGHLVSKSNIGELTILSGFSRKGSGEIRSVMAYRAEASEGGRTTEVFVSVSQKAKTKTNHETDRIQKLPESQVILEQRDRDAGPGSSLSVHQIGQNPAQALAFYRTQMIEQGWQPVSVPPESGIDTLVFQKGKSLRIIKGKASEWSGKSLVVIQTLE